MITKIDSDTYQKYTKGEVVKITELEEEKESNLEEIDIYKDEKVVIPKTTEKIKLALEEYNGIRDGYIDNLKDRNTRIDKLIIDLKKL